MDRKAELEKKRLKLAELRCAREKRQKSSSATSSASSLPLVNAVMSPLNQSGGRQAVDDLVQSLVGSHEDNATPLLSSAVSGESINVDNRSKTPVQLHVSATQTVEYLPAPVIHYDKLVQTADVADLQQIDAEAARTQEEMELAKLRSLIAAEERAKMMHEQQMKAAAGEQAEKEQQNSKALTEIQRDEILQSQEFSTFLSNSSKWMERAIEEKYDILKDYTVSADNTVNSESKIKLSTVFYDEKLVGGKSVTDLSWSAKYPELVLGAYSNNSDSNSSNTEGAVLVWNLHLQSRPEFVFTAQV